MKSTETLFKLYLKYNELTPSRLKIMITPNVRYDYFDFGKNTGLDFFQGENDIYLALIQGEYTE